MGSGGGRTFSLTTPTASGEGNGAGDLGYKNATAPGLVSTLTHWEGGVPGEGMDALHSVPHTLARMPLPWLYWNCLLYNKPVNVSQEFTEFHELF